MQDLSNLDSLHCNSKIDFASVDLTRTVDPVDVDVDAGPPQHQHDRVGVLLLDVVLKDDLVGEADAPLARVVLGEDAGATAHLEDPEQSCLFFKMSRFSSSSLQQVSQVL